MSKKTRLGIFFVTTFIITTICFCNMNSTLSYASDTTLSLNEIEEQVDDFVTIQKGSVWKGCEFSKEIALFNSDNEVTAYYIELVNDGKKCGYIIINAHNPYNIIEYSYQKDSFLNEAKKTVANEYNIAEHKQKIYYLGGINYAISGTNKDGNNHETYIRIADGWTNKANRYVWGSCKGNWNYVSIQIK